MRHLTLISLVISLLAACASFQEAPLLDDKITYNDLRSGKLTFGGISSSVDEWTSDQITTYSKIAHSAISSARRDLVIADTNYLLDKIGKTTFFEIHSVLKNGKLLTTDELDAMKVVSGDTRYVVFARIVSDASKKSSSYEHGYKPGDDNNVYTTSRELVVHLEVFDIRNATLAWSGEIKDLVSESNRNPHDASKSFFKDIGNTLIEDAVYGTYPAPISTETMLRHNFRKIAKRLPHPTCSILDECMWSDL